MTIHLMIDQKSKQKHLEIYTSVIPEKYQERKENLNTILKEYNTKKIKKKSKLKQETKGFRKFSRKDSNNLNKSLKHREYLRNKDDTKICLIKGPDRDLDELSKHLFISPIVRLNLLVNPNEFSQNNNGLLAK